MNVLTRGGKAIFDFVVGDIRLLLGTLVALLIVAGVVRGASAAAGPLLVVLLVGTLVRALRRELAP